MVAHPPLLREVLGGVDFRRLLLVRGAGQMADGLFQASLFSAVFFNPERATSAAQAASAFATVLLPYSLVGPFAGVFLDRWRRQRVLRNANLARAALVSVFATALALTGPTSAATVALALVVVSVNRFVLSGLSAALPHVVRPAGLVTANSFTTTMGGGAFALGTALSVGLRDVLGADDTGASRTALVAATGYLLAAVLAGRIAGDLLGPDDRPQHASMKAALGAVARGVVQGAQHVREHGPAARALAAITAHRFFYGLSFVTTLLLYTETGAIGLGLTGLGQVVSVSVVGSLIAALLTPRATRWLGVQRWIWLVFAGASAFQLVFGLPFTHAFFLVAAFGIGFAAQASKICVETLLQECVQDDFRGRVFSFYDTLFNLSFVAAAVVSGFLLPDDGKSFFVIAFIGVGYGLTALLYGVAGARRARFEPVDLAVAG